MKQENKTSETENIRINFLSKYSSKEIEAMKTALENVFDKKPDDETIQHYLDCGYLTLNTGRDGKDYAWYLDGDLCESCVSVDNLTEIDKETIENLF